MSIRSECKALVVHEGRILLNRCAVREGRVLYDLPGGGQRPYEPMESTVVREVAEETGYSVRVVRFCCLVEEITRDEAQRAAHPDYTHRVLHLFLTALQSEEASAPTECDVEQEDCIWVPLEEAARLPVRPLGIAPYLPCMTQESSPLFLSTLYS